MVAFINQPITNQKDLDNEGKITMGRRRKKSREQSAGTFSRGEKDRQVECLELSNHLLNFITFMLGHEHP